MSWSRPFDDPIPLPKGKPLVTLKDAAAYIMALPKSKRLSPEWQAAAEAVMMAAEDRGPRIPIVRSRVKGAMDMRDEWLRGLRSWASGNGNVRELWLFGSRADGSSRPASDVDIAVALMPAVGDHNWALGNFAALRHKEWKPQLEAIVGRHVSLEAILPDTPEDEAVRRSGVLLWARD